MIVRMEDARKILFVSAWRLTKFTVICELQSFFFCCESSAGQDRPKHLLAIRDYQHRSLRHC